MSQATTKCMEDVHVVYSGSVQIPICVGSVAIPLGTGTALHMASPSRSQEGGKAQSKRQQQQQQEAASTSTATPSSHANTNTNTSNNNGSSGGSSGAITGNRFTHKRYCYVRDGSELSEDCFYRWLLYHTNGGVSKRQRREEEVEEEIESVATTAKDHKSVSNSGRHSETPPPQQQQRKRARTDDGDGEDGAELPEGTSRTKEVEDALPLAASGGVGLVPRSPSLLYSFVDKVEFVVPSSFRKPRRVIRSPPFLIEDDTWAEHSVEIKVHFLPSLAIPPAPLMHLVLLQPRVVGVPLGLLSRNQGLPKLAPMVHFPNPIDNNSTGAATGAEERWRRACAAVTVSERQDMLRVLHPSFAVVEHFRRVLRKQRLPFVERLRAHFLAVVLGEAGDSDEETRERQTGQARSASEGPPIDTTHEPALDLHELPALYQRSVSAAADAAAEDLGFLLPAEACVYDHVQTRRAHCHAALEGALLDLQKEQAALCEGIEKVVRAMHGKAGALKEQLVQLHRACLAKREGGEK